MLGAFVSLHTLASIVQQIHTIARWCDIKTEQHANIVANVGNPELNITGASTGLDLVLFYIRTTRACPKSCTSLTLCRILWVQCRIAARLVLVCTPSLSYARYPPANRDLGPSSSQAVCFNCALARYMALSQVLLQRSPPQPCPPLKWYSSGSAASTKARSPLWYWPMPFVSLTPSNHRAHRD